MTKTIRFCCRKYELVHQFWKAEYQENTSLSILGRLFPGTLQIPKSAEAQVSCRKWCRSMHIVDLPHLLIPNCGAKVLFSFCSWVTLLIPGILRAECTCGEKKNPRRCGPKQFKPCCLRDQLYKFRYRGDQLRVERRRREIGFKEKNKIGSCMH